MMRAAPLVAACALALAGCGGEAGADRPPATRPRALAAYPPAVIPGRGELVAYVTRQTPLYLLPGGRLLRRIGSKTEFKSPRVLGVVERRGPWVAVLAAELRNGQLGWLDARRNTRLLRVRYALEADLSARRLTVRRLGRVVATTRIAIGRPAAPTPPGRYAVTDKLNMGGPNGPYGCCALALTGHQPNTPQGWGGGDRLAIHATPAEETIGQAVSTGCLRATNAVMRRLVREVPLGTPVRIHR